MGKRFTRLILHIGLEKTGTSSIQNMLEANRSRLSEAGFFLPRSLGKLNHKLLCAYAIDYRSKDIAIATLGLGGDKAKIDAFRAATARQFLADVEKREEPNCIITSEDLSRLFTAEEIKRVVALLSQMAEQIQVVVFLRRQDLLAMSRHYSFLLGGSKSGRVLGTDVQVMRYYRFGRNLGLWADEIGDENIRLVVFPEKPDEARFDAKEAFCNLVGIPYAELKSCKDANITLDGVNQIILENYNSLPPGNRIEFRKLRDLLQQFDDPRCKYLVGEPEARAFYENYRAENTAMFARFAPSLGFSDDFSMYPERNMRGAYLNMAVRRLLKIINQPTPSST